MLNIKDYFKEGVYIGPEYLNDSLYLDGTGDSIISLGNLKVCEGIHIHSSNLKSLDNLELVKEGMTINNCTNITSLGNLCRVEGPLVISGTPLKSFGSLQYALGGIYMDDHILIQSLGNLKYVKGIGFKRHGKLSPYLEESLDRIRNILENCKKTPIEDIPTIIDNSWHPIIVTNLLKKRLIKGV